MKGRLFSIVLVTILLCLALGNGTACTGEGPTTYTLTIVSTEGGDVTTPGQGTHTYNATDVVELIATAETNYHFVNWTGDVGTVADVEDATTSITMNGDYTITANFGFDMTFIDEVPDTNQPPTQNLPSTANPTNYCAPMAVVNVLGYWDVVLGDANARNLTAFLQPANLNTVAEYIGWFMDTNNAGSSARTNGGQPGTRDLDIAPGTQDYVRWDATHQFLVPPPPPPPLPAGKLGYVWTVTQSCIPDLGANLDFYKTEIDAGRPLVVSFAFWNPVTTDLSYVDPETEETVNVFAWGEKTSSSHGPNPEETWIDSEIGHAVTGVGYILNWDPDGAGPLLPDNYVIVHDNWSTTPENVAIPWANWNCLFGLNPGS
jgi:Divergent InlB B-repeat domain